MDTLNKLFANKRIWSLAYYDYGGICKFVKCIDLESGTFFFARVSSAYGLNIPDNFLKVELKEIERIGLVENSAEYMNYSLSDTPKNNLYEAIHMSGDEVLHRAVYEQIKRIGYCFRNIDTRIAIERNGVLCEMLTDFSLAWYKLPVNLTASTTWFPIVTIEFITESRNFSDYINNIDGKLSSILHNARNRQANIGKIDVYRFVTTRASMVNKKIAQLTSERTKLVQKLNTLTQRENILRIELEKLESSGSASHMRLQAEAAMSRVGLSRQLETIRELSLELIGRINENSESEKSLYLENEELFHDLTNMLKKLAD